MVQKMAGFPQAKPHPMKVDLKAWSGAAFLTSGMLLALCLAVPYGPPVTLFVRINQWAAEWPDALWSCLTLLGDTSVMLILLSPLLFFWPKVIPALIASIPLGGLLSVGLKWIYHAPRPSAVLAPQIFHEIGPHLTSQSFPSGHTLTGFALVSVLWVLSARLPTGGYRPLVKTLVLSVGLGVGLSRMALGVHWPTDVLAGACAGALSGLSGIWLSQRLQRFWQPFLCRVALAALLQTLCIWVVVRPIDYPLGMPMLATAVLMPTVTLMLFWVSRHRTNED